MNRDSFLVWDFDGTLAFRPGNWTGVVCEVVAVERASGVGEFEARRLVSGVRAAYIDPKDWYLFDDVRPVGLRAILVRSTHPDAAVQCRTLDEVVDVVGGT